MTFKLHILGLLLFAVTAHAAVDWTQAGVAGGVPNRVTVFTNMTTLDATGAQDISAGLANAIGLCPSNQVVQIPAGVFVLSNSIVTSQAGVTLRGQGSNTVIVGQCNAAAFALAGNRWYDDTVTVSSGYSKGSTNLVVASVPADLVVGECVHLMQSNNPSFLVASGIDGSVGEYALGQWLKVTAINGTTVTVWPPLYFSYSNQFQPFLKWPVNGGNNAQNFCQAFGIENLVFSNLNAGASAQFVSMTYCDSCWIKGVQSYWGSVDHVWLYDSYRCEIRDSLFSKVLPTITSSRCYGIQIGTPNIGSTPSQTSGLLLENNKFDLCRSGLIVGYGAAGCVFGYNYFASETNETPGTLRADIVVHSAFPMENLYEGNVAAVFDADQFHGNAGWQTLYRNWFAGRDWTHSTTSSLRSIELDAYHHNYVVEGNVLGYPGIGLDCTNLGGGALVLAKTPDTSWNYANWYKAIMFGYDGEGGQVTINDTNTFTTTTLTGNFNYLQNATNWDTNGVQTLAASLYRGSAPSWFSGYTWPPLGPDVVGYTNTIPAMNLFSATPAAAIPVNAIPSWLPNHL